jgi:uncharacterized lipoprotein YddW (UPF0748 family)
MPILKKGLKSMSKKWLVPGIDKTYPGIDHYVLDVEVPEVANLFSNVVAEFVQKYPTIDAVQWDDYLGYHSELPGNIDRTKHLTSLLQQTIARMKQSNPLVSFDICHHNPYWAKRYFAADWKQWQVDRAFIQAYNEGNFKDELNYAKTYGGVAISEKQYHRLKDLLKDPQIRNILIFPLDGNPEAAVNSLQPYINARN